MHPPIKSFARFLHEKWKWKDNRYSFIQCKKSAFSSVFCPIHVVTFTLISNLATDYIQKRSLASSLLIIICRQILYQCKSDYMDRASVELGCINVPLAISHRNLKFVQHCAVRKFESDCFQHANILNFRAYSRLQSRRRAEKR